MTLSLRRLIRGLRIVEKQQQLIEAQDREITWLHDRNQRLQLEHYREIQAMTCAWIISIETPEIDLRRDLLAMDEALAQRIAFLEEHIL